MESKVNETATVHDLWHARHDPSDGWPAPKVVQEQLGHSSIQRTMDTDLRVLPTM